MNAEEKLIPYFCPECEEYIFLMWSRENFSKVYRCLTCRSKKLKRLDVVYFGILRVKDLAEVDEVMQGLRRYLRVDKEPKVLAR